MMLMMMLMAKFHMIAMMQYARRRRNVRRANPRIRADVKAISPTDIMKKMLQQYHHPMVAMAMKVVSK